MRRARALLGGAKCGHAGSLDPFATGLLPIGVGRATRLLRFVGQGRKRYRATVRFGQATDTEDRTGAPLGPERPPPGEAEVRAALPAFVGEIEQRPPAYSAKHVGGRRAYRLAREGRPPEIPPVRVRVYGMELLDFRGAEADFRCEVGSGVYVRALARDLGELLGCGAHLTALRRTRVGPFRVEDAIRLPEGERAGPEAPPGAVPLLDPLAALSGLERLLLSPEGVLRLRTGRAAPFDEAAPEPVPGPAPEWALADTTDEGGADRPCAAVRPLREDEGEGLALVAVVTRTEEGWRPLVVWETAAPLS